MDHEQKIKNFFWLKIDVLKILIDLGFHFNVKFIPFAYAIWEKRFFKRFCY